MFRAWKKCTNKTKRRLLKYITVFNLLNENYSTMKAINKWKQISKDKKEACIVHNKIESININLLKMSLKELKQREIDLSDKNKQIISEINGLDATKMAYIDEIKSLDHTIDELYRDITDVQTLGNTLILNKLVNTPLPAGETAMHVMIAWANEILNYSRMLNDYPKNVFSLLLLERRKITEFPLTVFFTIFQSIGNLSAKDQVNEARTDESTAVELVELYVQMTNTTSVVTPSQLSSKNRGHLLLFLSALMRFFSQWNPNKEKSTNNNTFKELDKQVFLSAIYKQQQWIVTSFSAQHMALSIATDTLIDTSKYEGEYKQYMCINMTVLADCYGSKNKFNSHNEFMECVWSHILELHRIFCRYSYPHFTVMSFIRLMRDCNLLGSNDKINRNQLFNVLFLVIGTRVLNIYFLDEILSPHHFVICLVRVFYQIFSSHKSYVINPFEFSLFFRNQILPFALYGQLSSFRKKMANPKILTSFATWKKRLSDLVISKHSFTDIILPFDQLMLIAAQDHWINENFTEKDMYEALTFIQLSNPGPTGDLDLVELFELVVVMSIYNSPNPLKCLSHKIDNFIKEYISTKPLIIL